MLPHAFPINVQPETVEGARQIIDKHEARRSQLLGQGVPFYLYDQEDGVSWTEDIDRILNTSWCVDRPTHHLYRGEAFFIHQLRTHPWRTQHKHRAHLFVIPVFLHVAEHGDCSYTSSNVQAALRAIGNSPSFRSKPSRHLVVWTSPTAIRNANSALEALGSGRERVVIGALENHDARRHVVAPYSLPRHDVIPADYVERSRPIDFFFGGQSNMGTTHGMTHDGYYIRASIAQQHRSILTSSLSVFAFANEPGAATFLPPCDELQSSAQASRPGGRRGDEWKRAPVAPLTSSGACAGSYSAAAFAVNAKFILAPRGDIRTSPRPFEAVAHGAIPILIADRLFRAGQPFQCMVPWRLFSVHVSEASIMCDAVAALRNVTDSISPNKQAAMRTLMLHFRRDLLWRANSSRVAENLLVLAQRKMGVDKPLLPAAECSFLDEQRSDAGFRAHDEACRGRACCRPG